MDVNGSLRLRLLHGGSFLAIFFALYSLYTWADVFNRAHFTWLAASICSVIALFDPAVHYNGSVIFYDNAPRLIIVQGCDGVTTFILTVATVLSFPRPLGERMKGILMLLPLLFSINWMRLFILVDIRFYFPDYFRLFHVYLFQPLMIFVTFTCLMAWIVRVNNGAAKTP